MGSFQPLDGAPDASSILHSRAEDQHPRRVVTFEKFWKYYRNSYSQDEYAHFFSKDAHTKKETQEDSDFMSSAHERRSQAQLTGANGTQEGSHYDCHQAASCGTFLLPDGFEDKTTPEILYEMITNPEGNQAKQIRLQLATVRSGFVPGSLNGYQYTLSSNFPVIYKEGGGQA